MIEALRLNKHNKINIDCDLEPLGKVNVICGKNNSGKTSLLEALLDFENIHPGRIFSEELKTSLLDAWIKNSPNFTLQNSYQSYTLTGVFLNNQGIRDILNKIFESREIWYSKDYSEFMTEFILEADRIANFSDQGIRRYKYFSDVHHHHLFTLFREDETRSQHISAVIGNVLSGTWKALFDSVRIPKKSFLISPKRRIEQVAVNDKRDHFNTTGQWILKNLYELNNKLQGSIERKLYERISQSFKDVSIEYEFAIEVDDSNINLHFSKINEDRWLSASNCGLGLQDLLVIIYFSIISDFKWIMIEEPENHLHPELQRRLLQFLKEQTDQQKQFMISTHSSVFLDYLYVDSVFLTSIQHGSLFLKNSTNKSETLSLLGYSVVDNLVSDLIIVVEGSNDKKALNEFLKRMGLLGDYNIKFWILNGDFMENVDLSSLVENLDVMILLDNDPQSNRSNFLKQCKQLNIDVTILKRYSLENYYPLKVYKEAFAGISEKTVSLKDDKPIWGQLGGKISRGSIKKGSAGFAEKTDLSDLKGTDLLKFLRKVERRLKEKETKK